MRKLVVHTLTPKFREGTRIVRVPAPPAIGPSDVLVRMHWAGINASDVNASAGRYRPGVQPPFDIGFEGVGLVEGVGATAAAKGFAPGQPVAVLGMGCFAELVAADVSTVYRVEHATPDVVPLLIGGLTSSIGLEVAGEMRSGETVLVTGASGGTGLFAVQLAALAGNTVIGTCGSEDKAEVLRRLGCARAINYKAEDVEAVLRAEYPRGVDLVFEGVGGRMLAACRCRCAPAVTRRPRGGHTKILHDSRSYMAATWPLHPPLAWQAVPRPGGGSAGGDGLHLAVRQGGRFRVGGGEAGEGAGQGRRTDARLPAEGLPAPAAGAPGALTGEERRGAECAATAACAAHRPAHHADRRRLVDLAAWPPPPSYRRSWRRESCSPSTTRRRSKVHKAAPRSYRLVARSRGRPCGRRGNRKACGRQPRNRRVTAVWQASRPWRTPWSTFTRGATWASRSSGCAPRRGRHRRYP